MAIRQFALRLDDASQQTGNTTMDFLAHENAPVDFQLANVVSGTTNQLNLITCKTGVLRDHPFNLTVNDGTASVQLSAAQMLVVYQDGEGGDWDFIEAKWTVGQTDTLSTSVMQMIQNATPYDYSSWPPKPKK